MKYIPTLRPSVCSFHYVLSIAITSPFYILMDLGKMLYVYIKTLMVCLRRYWEGLRDLIVHLHEIFPTASLAAVDLPSLFRGHKSPSPSIFIY